ncbi:hypothetical protein H312_03651 [Anncaliia algerae PRA339]|uniref:Uncharacterized protein n=1 Tax=Anncaliia algerae PRA339 TaxID=1288291 RepID=A0A059EW66_9MICR|nr:hypothetical protein H312_03651 [Anncaliia algerae PRA339]
MPEMVIILSTDNEILTSHAANIKDEEEMVYMNELIDETLIMIKNAPIPEDDQKFFYGFNNTSPLVSVYILSDGMKILLFTEDKNSDEVYDLLVDLYDCFKNDYFMDNDDFPDNEPSNDQGPYYGVAR